MKKLMFSLMMIALSAGSINVHAGEQQIKVTIPHIRSRHLESGRTVTDRLNGLVAGTKRFSDIELELGKTIPLTSPELEQYRFIYIVGKAGVDFDASETASLAGYLQSDGFLVFDNVVEKRIKELLPGFEYRIVPAGHSIYAQPFDIPPKHSLAGFRGIWQNGKLVGIYGTAIGGLWSELNFNEQAVKKGVNMICYSIRR